MDAFEVTRGLSVEPRKSSRCGGGLIPFTKAHACGNDFLIVSEAAVPRDDRPDLVRRLCARTTGVGADGIEFFAWAGPASGRIWLYNADGSKAEISGNGTRCVAAWMAEALHCQAGDVLEITTDAGVRLCHLDRVRTDSPFSTEVTTGMGIPTFVPHTVRLGDGTDIVGIEVSTGNPHFVILVDNGTFKVGGRPWEAVGAEIFAHADFPGQTNVEFVRIEDEHQIAIRIFERGVGPTTSSGTGSSAAATAVLAVHQCLSPLKVASPGGGQTVAWEGPGRELRLTGPAALIARGEAW
jgi:diaminopimelate epimerase